MKETAIKLKGEDAPGPGWIQRVLIGRDPRWTLVRAVIWVAVIWLVANYVLLPIRVRGVSMLPTYQENGYKLVNCLVYKFHPPQRGDIVAIRLAGKHLMYCKRVVALPGETIAFHEGHILINGQVLDEPYLKRPCNWEQPPEAVGPNEYYVVGDNREMGFHDHEQGRATRERIVGKVFP